MALWTGMAVRMYDLEYDGTVERLELGGGADRTERGREGRTGSGTGSGTEARWGSRVPITTVETCIHAAEMTVSRRQIVWFSRGGSVKYVGDVRDSGWND